MPPKRAASSKSSDSVPCSSAKRHAPSSDTESDCEYRQRRERNNVAVKKSREKSRARARLTATKVDELQRENGELEGRINVLSKELNLLKELLVLRAGKKAETDSDSAQASTSTAHTVEDTDDTVAASRDLVDQDHRYVLQTKKPCKKS